jgi:transcription initiation factor TFIIIB Brf1 subunit/transcription initiation factor TFIIB
MPEYDLWYKEVLRGKTKSYYPNRIRLLENPGMFMFLFHIDYHAIVGEAQVVRTTKEDKRNLYWFNNFISYPHPVQLELLETDSRLRWIFRKSRACCVYIGQESINEIRILSKLSEKERLKIGKDFDRALRQIKKSSSKKEGTSTHNFDIDEECQKLNRNFEMSERVLTEAKKHYFSFVRKKSRGRRSLYETFYASLYLAFRTLEIPKLLHEISSISGVSSKKLAKLYRLMVKELDIEVKPVDVEELVKCQSIRLGISDETIDRAVAIIREERIKGNLIGRAPSVEAAVAVFTACQEREEKKELKKIAESFWVSMEAIRSEMRGRYLSLNRGNQ